MKKLLIIFLSAIVIIPILWLTFYKFEGNEPIVDINLPEKYLNQTYEMKLTARDSGTGLRNVTLSIVQKGKENVLLNKKYPYSFSIYDLIGKHIIEDQFNIPLNIKDSGISDGEAEICIRVSDFSWRSWNKGNTFYKRHKIIIDNKPPQIEVLTNQHNLIKGGAGLVIYRLSESNVISGVRVGENFFPGHSGLFDDKMIYASFFGLSYTQGPETEIMLLARDSAGNESQKEFYNYIRDKKFKTDIINISDNFLETIIRNFDLGQSSVDSLNNQLLDKFLFINDKLRQINVEKILSVPKNTTNKILWHGRFTRLAGTAKRADFGDSRIYRYKGEEIDRATHLGIDLASTANADINAANSGRVLLAEYVGIFGNTVMIDHGFGLVSLYSHLRNIKVNKGDLVTKKTIIGNTGITGFAAGDHLHFSMLVHNVFVNPLEWWDTLWIKNNIISKIEAVKNLKGKNEHP